MMRNMRSAGIDLEPWVRQGLLQFHADRPTRFGLETHLVILHRAVDQFRPDVVVIDPVTNLLTVGTDLDVRAMLTRLIDFLKVSSITAFFTSLTSAGGDLETSEAMISSLMDAWIIVTSEVHERRRQRWIYILKSRGMAHSDEMRAFRISSRGIEVLPARPAAAQGR